jgi:hypothetical protein
MSARLRERAIATGAIAVALIALAGIASATIPDADGVIHACYKKSSPNQGTLSVIDTGKGQSCSGGETPLTWSQTGPEGPQGPQGPQGIQGPQGPSDAWFADQSSQTIPVLGSEIVVSLNVPAGEYLLSSQVNVAGSTDTTGVFCLFRSPTADTTVTESFADVTLAPGQAQTFAMTGTAHVLTGSGGAELELECQDRTQPSTSSYDVTGNLTALQVGALR